MRRKCWLPAFSSFPTMFSERFFFKTVKMVSSLSHKNPEKFGDNILNVSNGGIFLVNPFPDEPWFLRVCSGSLLKTISPFPTFSTRFKNFVIFIKFEILVCKLFQFGSLKFVLLERVKRQKHCGKWRKCWLPVFSPVLKMF